MAKAADIGTKRLISLKPVTWARWLTGLNNLESLGLPSGEFQWVSRTNDALLRVRSPEYGEFLIANEIQLRPDPKMPRRMRAYAALAEEHYQLPVYPVVVNILSKGAESVIDHYHLEFMGLKAYQDFKVINLGQVPVNLVFEQELMTLLPFVPVLQGGHKEAILTKALNWLKSDEELAHLETLLAFMASFVHKTEVVQRLMRWDMAILRESPWYEQILQEGVELGLEQGMEKGRQEGQTEVALRLLKRRFTYLPAEYEARIESLEAEPLLRLIDLAVEATSLAEIDTFLLNEG